MKDKTEKTEPIKIRVLKEDKIRLQKIAKNEGRTFAGQVRYILREWLKTFTGRD